MSDAPILSKYAQYLNKYKPDAQSTTSDYKKRLEELKKQIVSPVTQKNYIPQSKQQQLLTPASPINPSKLIMENQLQLDLKNIKKLQTQAQTQQQQAAAEEEIAQLQPKLQEYKPPIPSIAAVPDALIDPNRPELSAEIRQNLREADLPKWYKQLSFSLLQQPFIAVPKSTPKLPQNELVLERQLVCECCQILLGAKQTDVLFVVSNEQNCSVQIENSLSFQQKQTIQKIINQTISDRNSVIKHIQLYQDQNLSKMTRKFGNLLYEAVITLDKSIVSIQQSAQILLELDQNLTQIYFTYQILSSLVLSASNKQGAQLIQHLEEFYKDHAGLPHQKIVSYLLFEMLKFYAENLLFGFISSGKIPKNGEFLVENVEKSSDFQYFKLSSQQVHLLDPIASEIVILGRNQHILERLNVHRQDVAQSQTPQLLQLASNGLTSANLVRKINLDNPSPLYQFVQQHAKASQQLLLTALQSEHHLVATFHSINKFFLFAPSDLYQIFLETAQAELDKPKTQVNLIRLNNLFQLSAQTSSLKLDENIENVSISTSEMSFLQIFELVNYGKVSSQAPDSVPKILNSLQLNFRVSFPLSIVFNEEHFTVMNLVFRRFLRQKLVEITLNSTWKRLNELKVTRQSRRFNLLYRVLNKQLSFVNIFNFHTNLAVQQVQESFKTNMRLTASLDDFDNNLRDFQRQLIKRLKLTNQGTVKRTDRIFADCLVFCNFVEKNFSVETKEVVREKVQYRGGDALVVVIEQNRTALEKLEAEFDRKQLEWANEASFDE
ncbi:putative Spc97 / Spc98 family protein [Spironucleus salmonicida]|uniref:Spc97 / Spc98 family protein n=1 Tax=Spironucleus salmonicida TaxID=348837 RepID=V6LEW3_9EUKA|nr:putative Spc97 / Spc98 family protein [Spironucleus salmonicida]|eukprot:EST43037.1 Tubulin, small gamma tubulin complex gcp2 [Spironucleus salmonicida]